MLSFFSIAALLARGRQLLTGPGALAIAATAIAVLFVGAIALGLVWLRGDAARDAAAKAVAVCEAAKLQSALAAERAKAAKLEDARREREATIAMLRKLRESDAGTIDDLNRERANALDAARKWEAAAGRRAGTCLRSDDPWLRRSAAGADDADGAARR
jgi:hypothetical protein